MIFAVIGLFKPAALPEDAAFEAEINAQIGQPLLRIVNAGYLRGPQGQLTGVLTLLDVESFEQAQSYADASPYQRGGYFERVEVAEFRVEVGRLG